MSISNTFGVGLKNPQPYNQTSFSNSFSDNVQKTKKTNQIITQKATNPEPALEIQDTPPQTLGLYCSLDSSYCPDSAQDQTA